MLGGAGGQTVTVKLHEFVLPPPSTAVQTTVVTPFEKVLPDGGEQLKLARPQSSRAPDTYVTTEPLQLVVVTVLLVLQVTVGGVVSITVTVKVQLFDPPISSVARQTTLLTPNRKPVPEGGMQVIGT